MRYSLCFVILALALSGSFSSSAAGEISFDLRADTILYYFPAPDSIAITADFTLFSSNPRDTFFLSDIGTFLDGVSAGYTPLEITALADECFGKEEEDCTGDCQDMINGVSKSGICIFWQDPRDSLLAVCMCTVNIRWFSTVAYAGEAIVSFELDLIDAIAETDELNNSFQLFIGPIDRERSSWGRIKSLD
ncbi:MAG: hypothetical protein JW814_04680 [Candidatus Krumholzibacteriota bacterium]|nr:hypothetical protein [Candidatus Krumholzibacteriota bacterium]